MNYADKMKMLNTEKSKLALRLSRLVQKEKTLNSVAKKFKRAEDEKRKYKLGGLVLAAFSFLEIDDFEDAEMLGALIKIYESNKSKTARMVYKQCGENQLFQNRHSEKQSASAQGFTQSEVENEVVNAVS